MEVNLKQVLKNPENCALLGIPQGVSLPVMEAARLNGELSIENESLRLERDRLRNSLAERAEECEGLRRSNQSLAAQVAECKEAMKDKRRLDWLGKMVKTKVIGSPLLMQATIEFAFRGDIAPNNMLRDAIDEAMSYEEERRQDRISELQVELGRLLREGEAEQ